jgi:hypothetical protein
MGSFFCFSTFYILLNSKEKIVFSHAEWFKHFTLYIQFRNIKRIINHYGMIL